MLTIWGSFKSRFEVDMEALAWAWMLETERRTAECPYCRGTFVPRFIPPTKDEQYGRWQVYCSKLCKRLHKEETKEEAECALGRTRTKRWTRCSPCGRSSNAR